MAPSNLVVLMYTIILTFSCLPGVLGSNDDVSLMDVVLAIVLSVLASVCLIILAISLLIYCRDKKRKLEEKIMDSNHGEVTIRAYDQSMSYENMDDEDFEHNSEADPSKTGDKDMKIRSIRSAASPHLAAAHRVSEDDDSCAEEAYAHVNQDTKLVDAIPKLLMVENDLYSNRDSITPPVPPYNPDQQPDVSAQENLTHKKQPLSQLPDEPLTFKQDQSQDDLKFGSPQSSPEAEILDETENSSWVPAVESERPENEMVNPETMAEATDSRSEARSSSHVSENAIGVIEQPVTEL